MSLKIGTQQASSGMTKAIYDAMDAELRPPLEEDLDLESAEGEEYDQKLEIVTEAQDRWRKLSYSIAKGVVTYMQRDPATETEYAEVFSSRDQDSAYWDWLEEFADTLETWAASSTSTMADLKSSLKSFLSHNQVPDRLRGVIK